MDNKYWPIFLLKIFFGVMKKDLVMNWEMFGWRRKGLLLRNWEMTVLHYFKKYKGVFWRFCLPQGNQKHFDFHDAIRDWIEAKQDYYLTPPYGCRVQNIYANYPLG